MARIIFDAQVRINNETFPVVPNSVRINRGGGESEMKPQSSGNGKVEHVFSENVETKIGKIMLSVYVTSDNIQSIKTLKDNRENNYVSISSGSTQFVMNKAALVNDPELPLSSEGKAELEFHGAEIK